MKITMLAVSVLCITTRVCTAEPMDEAQTLIADLRRWSSVAAHSTNSMTREAQTQTQAAMERLMYLARDHNPVAALLVAELTNNPVPHCSVPLQHMDIMYASGLIQGALSPSNPRAYLEALNTILDDHRWDGDIVGGYISTLQSYLLYPREYSISSDLLKPILEKAGKHPHKIVRLAAARLLLGREPNIPPVDRTLGTTIIHSLISQASNNFERTEYYTLLLEAGLGRDEYTHMLESAIQSEDDPFPFVVLLHELGVDTQHVLEELLSRATPDTSNRLETLQKHWQQRKD